LAHRAAGDLPLRGDNQGEIERQSG
jgi:hypothetical protein